MKADIRYNSLHLIKDGKPWFPVMGEMHFSRYREDLWEESLRKMKAGGLTIVSAYVIWIHHEEEEGIFDFSGTKNIKRFFEACENVGIKLFLRLGPWVHGEVRNGGFPDWVVNLGKEGVDLRSNDEKYLFYVKRYWEKIYEEVHEFFEKEDGPVIGIQIENEYGHVGGYTGQKGEAHMKRLLELAKEIGFNAPMYTATGWGGAVIGDCIPVMGGYCEAPWDQSVNELSPNTNYVISHTRNDALIACDHHVEGAVTFDESKFPYLTAELGGGLQVTSHRRPVATGSDIGAMSLTKLASGVSLLGYYMYHGGSNPKGKLSTLQESRASGYINDLPEINYDFNAPIRQYGTISDNLKEIKLYALFLNDFGEDLATLPATILPPDVKPEDMHILRTSVRHDDTHGYVFFNNYQRRNTMESHKDVVFKGICKDGEILFDKTGIYDGEYGFFPYNMKLGDAVLKHTLATPLCKINDSFVFYSNGPVDFVFKNDVLPDFINISRKDALNAWKVHLDRDYLVINEDFVWEESGELVVCGSEKTTIKAFPEFSKAPKGFVKVGKEKDYTVYERDTRLSDITTSIKEVAASNEDGVSYEITIDYPSDFNFKDRTEGFDALLNIDYEGYQIDIYKDGEKINDHFYTGQKVPLSLGYFGFPKDLTVKVTPLYEDSWVYIEKWPELPFVSKDNKKYTAKLLGIEVSKTVR